MRERKEIKSNELKVGDRVYDTIFKIKDDCLLEVIKIDIKDNTILMKLISGSENNYEKDNNGLIPFTLDPYNFFYIN